MSIPTSIQPFVEPEVENPSSVTWLDRARRVPGLVPLTALLTVLILWSDVARKGPWPWLPDPIQLLGQRMNVAGFWMVGAFGVALAIGVFFGRRRGRLADVAPVALPRLPVFVRFDGRPVVVVGGGTVAAAKIPALLDAGADVTVVAPAISSSIDRARVRIIERAFEPRDLDGAWFVTAAAPPSVNRAVRDAAEARAVFVNAVDDAANATAFLGGVIARSGVTVAISTSGRAPALAGLLREALDRVIPQDVDRWADLAHRLSKEQRAGGVPMAERRPRLLEELNRLYQAPSDPR